MNGYNRENYSCLKPTNTFTVPAVKAPVIYSDEEEEEEEEKPVFEERKILPGFALLKKMAKLDKKIKKKTHEKSQLDLDVLEKSFKTVLGRF